MCSGSPGLPMRPMPDKYGQEAGSMWWPPGVVRATLVILSVLAGGCGDTRVGFCSGGEEFCGDFFSTTFSDDDSDDQGDEDPTDQDPNDDADVEMAAAVSGATPAAIERALVRGTMPHLSIEDPGLVGLWLIAGTQGALASGDNLRITRFLDQNRTWVPSFAPAKPIASQTFRLGLAALSEFSLERDPGLSSASREAGGVVVTEVSADDVVISPRAREILAVATVERCCPPHDLAAAAVVLCASATANEQFIPACQGAARWLDAWESLVPQP